KYIIVSQARITPFTCEGRTRLNESQEIPPKASGVTNSVARTSPKRSTTVSQMIDERIQCFAAPSGKGEKPLLARAVSGAGASDVKARDSPIAGANIESRAPQDRRNDEVVIGRSCSGHIRCVRVRGREVGMRILVIEDEPRIMAFLARGLEAEGFSVDGADDGRSGVERAARGSYDLVILDLLLPKLDGFAVLRQLQNRLPELPVVIVSARSELETKLRGFDLGASDYLSKPFSFDELLARVRAQLRRGRPGENGSVVRAGLLSLDVA